jgi:hypothetical protein
VFIKGNKKFKLFAPNHHRVKMQHAFVSEKARLAASALRKKMPASPMRDIGYGRVAPYGGPGRYSSPEVNEEKSRLYVVARIYARKRFTTALCAHGTRCATDLCQIFLDKELRLSRMQEHFGALYSNNVNNGGHRDDHWGVFVFQSDVVEKAQRDQLQIIIPLSKCEAILFPTPIVEAVIESFPNFAGLIKGYQQYSEELAAQIQNHTNWLSKLLGILAKPFHSKP